MYEQPSLEFSILPVTIDNDTKQQTVASGNEQLNIYLIGFLGLCLCFLFLLLVVLLVVRL